MLFESELQFDGLPEAGFDLFELDDRDERRHEIVRTIHPALALLGEDLVERLNSRAEQPLHPHLPRLDWPRDYQPFCTWLALSTEAHGYQAGPQLNVGVHRDYVAVRLGWDTSAPAFGRFEFLASVGDLGQTLRDLVPPDDLRFRVYAASPWPEASSPT